MLTRHLTRPFVRPLTRRVTEPFGGWSPLALFAAGEQGAWYDPSDLSTLFQDAAGTTPVTALGQPVGLMLDKSKGLVRGPELVTNGGFDDATGWTLGAGWSVSGGALRISKTGTALVYADHLAPGDFVTGKTYRLRFDYSLSTGSLNVYVRGASAGVFSVGVGTKTFDVVAGSSVFTGLRFATTLVDVDGWVDNISLREVPGNHAIQPTATARPVLAAGNKIDFDGVDDKLTTTFPDLGSNVTIVRSVPGTGASILAGQTIGAGARDDSTDHHGLLIINRALTAPETASLTRWLNQRAGV